MNPQPNPQDSLVLSYLGLRKAVGIIGFALPFVLAIAGPGIQGSISCYYYTDMRNVLVGSLCAIGVFLMSTRGYDLRDEIAGRLACVFAIGVLSDEPLRWHQARAYRVSAHLVGGAAL